MDKAKTKKISDTSNRFAYYLPHNPSLRLKICVPSINAAEMKKGVVAGFVWEILISRCS